MNKQEAYQSMLQGNKVCNEYYSPEEYAFINSDGLIEYEDGCVVGDEHAENWVKYQDPYSKFEWSIWIDPTLKIKSDIESMRNYSDPYLKSVKESDDIHIFINRPKSDYQREFYPKKEFSPKNHKRTNHKKK